MDRSVTRFVWDVTLGETRKIYEDIGIQELDDNSVDDTTDVGCPKNSFTTPENQHQTPTKNNCPTARHACKCQLFQNCKLNDENNPFDSLSDEIILCILSWLPRHRLARCACVSKRWNRLCMDDYLWKTVDLSERKFLPGTVTRILERVGTAAKLSRSTIHAPLLVLRDKERKKPIEFPLQYLDLSMCNTDPETLGEIVSSCHNLRKLSLESCIVDRVALETLRRFKNLEELNLCMCQEVDGKVLCAAVGQLPRLKALNLGWLNLSKASVSRLVMNLHNKLEKLNLSGCRDSLSDNDVENLVARCPSLTELDLSDANTLTGDIFESLEQLPYLQHLALSRCYRIPNPARLSECLKRLVTLRAVELFGLITETDLKTLSGILSPVHINTHPFYPIARPTVSFSKRRYVWEINCKI